MRYLISVTLILAGLIHLLPVSGMIGPERLSALYGIGFEEPNLAILMRHRAVLLGLLGAFLVAAAFLPALQPSAFALGFASVLSFLFLAWSTGNYNPNVAKVVAADVVAAVLLVIGLVAYVLVQRRS
ncbi:hypothetical protein [Arenimonas oryziterrae]|uniref:Phosphopantetheine adenylyltransferase n=1 Tax=Arenimonas oryziterrae DSM 21050 = YC6267 TaxID=1121015 RepID=A0A091AZW0_9GAMM|nr:hypothetical protein [Arenimonas oryziterrae]KFN44946.1 hypothetical protein N789_02685 [Arenimonas oryziterrae DSM 21050 = YC6267]